MKRVCVLPSNKVSLVFKEKGSKSRKEGPITKRVSELN